ncbi:MAG: alpha/beta hydrolase, partial [Cyclobacteriaceae bacterium]
MKRFMFYLSIVIVLLILTTVAITYPSFQKQMTHANERIKEESRLLNTKFGTMEYALQGNGKPVLLIHGAGGGFDQALWLGRICLSQDYFFIAPSKFGYINSDIPKEYSAQRQAEAYKILLDHLDIDKVTVIGVSAGGPSSMQFANDYPERVEKLILVSAVSMPPNESDKDPFLIKVIQVIQKSDYVYWLVTKAFESQMLSLFGIPSDDFKNFTTEQKQLAREMLEVMHPMSIRYQGTLTDGLIIANFTLPEGIEVPTLIVHSKNDGLVHYSHATHSHKRILGS